MDDLTGRRALVTGGTTGIGRAIARTLAGAGAEVVLSGRDAERGAAVVAEIEAAGGAARFVAADLADSSQVRALATAAGDVDVLVNNAGVFPGGPSELLAESDLDLTFAVNVKAAYLLAAALAPGMLERGRGSIVNITTMAAEVGMPGLAAYGASKAALAQLTRAWALEWGPRGVRVNAVSPGPTHTDGTAAMGDAFGAIVSTIPLGRAADPAEIAEAVLFLAGERGSFVNGSVFSVDGGRAAA